MNMEGGRHRAANSAQEQALALSPLARLVRCGFLSWFRRTGWTVGGILPEGAKFVIMAAPHTSNWDFLVFLGTIEGMGLRPRFMGKASLFRWPAGDFMRGLGGVPIDRSARQDLVTQMAARIGEADEFALVIAAEGTREPNREWRSGFYRIALAAGVPIICAGPDYGRKIGLFGPIIHPTGDMEADLAPAYAFFRTLVPRHPERVLFPDGFGMDGPPPEA